MKIRIIHLVKIIPEKIKGFVTGWTWHRPDGERTSGGRLKKYAMYWGVLSSLIGLAGLIAVAVWWGHISAGVRTVDLGGAPPTAAAEQQSSGNTTGTAGSGTSSSAGQSPVNQSTGQTGGDEGDQGRTEADDSLPLTVQDLPSPVNSTPIRGIGTYYSETLRAYLYHAGKDYAMPEGAVIRATHGGTVTYAGEDLILGQKVILDCGQDWQVVYGGLDNLRVKTGDVVQKNDVLGQIGYDPGTDGDNSRSQLHYEVWHGDQIVDFP